MSKRSTKPAKANLVVSQGPFWRVEFDRVTKDYIAIVDGVGCIGCSAKPHQAQTLIAGYCAGLAKHAA